MKETIFIILFFLTLIVLGICATVLFLHESLAGLFLIAMMALLLFATKISTDKP